MALITVEQFVLFFSVGTTVSDYILNKFSNAIY